MSNFIIFNLVPRTTGPLDIFLSTQTCSFFPRCVRFFCVYVIHIYFRGQIKHHHGSPRLESWMQGLCRRIEGGSQQIWSRRCILQNWKGSKCPPPHCKRDMSDSHRYPFNFLSKNYVVQLWNKSDFRIYTTEERKSSKSFSLIKLKRYQCESGTQLFNLECTSSVKL